MQRGRRFFSSSLSSVVDSFKSFKSISRWAANTRGGSRFAGGLQITDFVRIPGISIPHLFHGNYKNNSDLYLTAYHEGESYLYAARWLVC